MCHGYGQGASFAASWRQALIMLLDRCSKPATLCCAKTFGDKTCKSNGHQKSQSHSSTRRDLPKCLAHLQGMAKKPRANFRIPKNSTNSARVALAFIQRKEQCFQVDYDFKKLANPRHFPSFPVSHRWHLFQGRLCDLRCSLAVPGNQGIRHRRGDRTKDPYIQGLKKHHVSVIKKMGENLGSDFFLNLWLLNTCKYNSLLSLNMYIYIYIYTYICIYMYMYISQNII